MSGPRPVGDSNPEDDAAWEDLVRRFHESGPDGEGSDGGDTLAPDNPERPDDLDEPGPDRFIEPAPAPRPRSSGTWEPEGGWPQIRPLGPRDYEVEDNLDSGDFEPEEPPTISRAEPAIVLSWVGVVVSLLTLLGVTVFVQGAPPFVGWAAILVFLGSAGYLFYRLPRHRDNNDDGARV